jgi:MFS family permease
MADDDPRLKPKAIVAYDGDQKLMAFLGAVAFVVGALFWGLLAVRLWGTAAAIAAALMVPLCAIVFVLAWGLRVKMEHEVAVTRWDVRRLLIASVVLGVVVGALPYVILRFKLEDPDFLNLASEPANLPPAWR